MPRISVQCLPLGELFDHISSCYAPDHQGAGADVPPKDRLPIMCGTEGPLLWLVCPGGQVSSTHTHAHIDTFKCMHTATDYHKRPHMQFHP